MSTKTYIRFSTKLFTALLAGFLLLTACTPTSAETSTPINTATSANGKSTQIPVTATGIPATEVSPSAEPSEAGTAVTFGPLALVVPPGVASGASSSDYPPFASDDAAWWQKTPGHLQLMLGDYYVLQGKFHQPQIYVYPAQAYAEMVPAAFESIRRLDNILYGSGGSISADQLPTVPFMNAQQLLAANIQAISFQNGGGVRFLTEYGQYNAPINNHELFYQFQGVTRDGAYYVIAIFPITAPALAETSDAAAALPPSGIPFPDLTASNADGEGYYTAITDLLNGTAADVFTPSLNQLDALIASMQIAAP
jgi:hypothetical protein